MPSIPTHLQLHFLNIISHQSTNLSEHLVRGNTVLYFQAAVVIVEAPPKCDDIISFDVLLTQSLVVVQPECRELAVEIVDYFLYNCNRQKKRTGSSKNILMRIVSLFEQWLRVFMFLAVKTVGSPTYFYRATNADLK